MYLSKLFFRGCDWLLMSSFGKKICKSLVVLVPLICIGQEPNSALSAEAQRKEASAGLPLTPLEIVSSAEVASFAEPNIALPLLCAAGNRIFVRMASFGALADLMSMSGEGQNIVRFERAKINDITQPVPAAFFATDSDVYLLTTGSIATGESRKARDPTGLITEMPGKVSRNFIAHFRSDGSYVGAISLDISFTPFQLGAFPDGSFLLAGVSRDGTEPRVGLVGSNGQFRRFVNLSDDIELRHDQPDIGKEVPPNSLPRIGKHFGESFSDSLHNSSIVAWGRNLLLIRSGQDTPVFSISAGGDVQAVHLEVPKGYKLWGLKTAGNEWTALYTRRISDSQGVEFATFALDPTSGKAVARYTYPRFLGFAMACSDGIEFSFLVRENDKLKIVKLLPTRRSSRNSDAAASEKQPQ